jgi:hypothetical protein
MKNGGLDHSPPSVDDYCSFKALEALCDFLQLVTHNDINVLWSCGFFSVSQCGVRES